MDLLAVKISKCCIPCRRTPSGLLFRSVGDMWGVACAAAGPGSATPDAASPAIIAAPAVRSMSRRLPSPAAERLRFGKSSLPGSNQEDQFLGVGIRFAHDIVCHQRVAPLCDRSPRSENWALKRRCRFGPL
jgi:hypothetical protein